MYNKHIIIEIEFDLTKKTWIVLLHATTDTGQDIHDTMESQNYAFACNAIAAWIELLQ